jgi:hypothetical protein
MFVIFLLSLFIYFFFIIIYLPSFYHPEIFQFFVLIPNFLFIVSIHMCITIRYHRTGCDMYEKNAYLFIALTDCTFCDTNIDRWTPMITACRDGVSNFAIRFGNIASEIVYHRNIYQKWLLCAFIAHTFWIFFTVLFFHWSIFLHI